MSNNNKNKPIRVINDGETLGVYPSIIEAVYKYNICSKSIRKSAKEGTYIKGYKFKYVVA